MLPYRTGFVLPALQFGCDGTTFEITGEAAHYDGVGVRLSAVDGERCPRPEAERALAGFVDSVVRKLESDAIDDCEVALTWRRVCASRADPAEAAFCEAAGALDIDPYAIDDEDATFIEQASEWFEGEALIEFLAGGVRGGNGTVFSNRVSTVSWLRDLESRQPYECKLPTLVELRKDFGQSAVRRPQEPAWSQGYRVANMLAKELRVDGRKLATPEALAKRFGAEGFQRVHADSVEPGIRAVTSGACIHLRDRGRGTRPWAPQAETFALARAIGGALCFPQARRQVVNILRDAEHQATGRAFAAELLAPIEEIRGMLADGLEDDEVAQEFKVSTQVVKHQLENHERIVDAQAFG